MKKIYVIHENNEWLIPLRKSFKKINAPFEEWHMNKESFDYYLNEYYKSTNMQSLKESISNLQESQMQTLMLASSNSDYVFKILDAPFVPETKSSPNRALICIIITFLGFILSILYILVVHYSRRN